MSKIFTNNFKTFVIDQTIANNPQFFMFLGKHQPFADDTNPPLPLDRVSETYTGAYDTMIVGKGISPDDITHMIPRIDWTYGTGYKAYRHTSGDLYGNAFYVSVTSSSGYDVFKCLSNNGVESIAAPDLTATSPSDDIYETIDGYQWKYMYSIPTATFNKFATRDYIPVSANTDVVAAAVDGAIDYIDIVYGGSNYDTYTTGTIQSLAVGGNTRILTIESSASPNTSFYVGSALKITQGTGAGQLRIVTDYSVSGATRTVVIDREFDIAPTTTSTYEITPHVVLTGGGTGFVGRALVNTAASNTIYKVEVVNRGNGYYYGDAYVAGNTGGVSNSAILSVVIGPRGGHGSDPIKELGGKYLCMTTTFDSTTLSANGKLLDTQQFRSIGVLVDPLFANVEISYTDATGVFAVGETVTQQGTNVTGTVVFDSGNALQLTNVNGNFYTGNTSTYYIRGSTGVTPPTAAVVSVRNNGNDVQLGVDGHPHADYVNMLTRVELLTSTGTFLANEIVTMSGNVSTSNAVVYYSDSTSLWLSTVRGEIGPTITGTSSATSATVGNILRPDLIYGSGDILYMENISPINKTSGQTETIKAIIEF